MITSGEAPNLLLCSLLVLGGIFGAFLKKMADLEAAGTILSPWTFVKSAPYKSLLAVLGAYLLLLSWYYMGMLNPLVAIFTGASCNEAFDSLRTRAIKRMRDDAEGP
jgi:hypothetical protein